MPSSPATIFLQILLNFFSLRFVSPRESVSAESGKLRGQAQTPSRPIFRIARRISQRSKARRLRGRAFVYNGAHKLFSVCVRLLRVRPALSARQIFAYPRRDVQCFAVIRAARVFGVLYRSLYRIYSSILGLTRCEKSACGRKLPRGACAENKIRVHRRVSGRKRIVKLRANRAEIALADEIAHGIGCGQRELRDRYYNEARCTGFASG